MRTITIAITAILSASCSIIADPDAFTYIEGSATDKERQETSGDSTDTDDGTGTDENTDIGGGTDTVSTDSTDDTPSTDPIAKDICERNADCETGSICPVLFTNDFFQEDESHCYLDCRTDISTCDGTENPLCYQYSTGAVCLERAKLSGTFACRLLAATAGNQIELRVRPEDTPVRLERCEMFSDDAGFGFIFSTVLGEAVLEASVYVPDVRVGDLQTGLLETGSGEIFRKILDADMSPIESTLLGFFPTPDMAQTPRLIRDIDILEITAAGPIRGEIQFDGFAYNATMAL